MKPLQTVTGFTDHALQRFMKRSGLTSTEKAMKRLVQGAECSTIVSSRGDSIVCESLKPDKHWRVWVFVIRGGIIQTTYWRKATLREKEAHSLFSPLTHSGHCLIDTSLA
jgi:hypothetical protein